MAELGTGRTLTEICIQCAWRVGAAVGLVFGAFALGTVLLENRESLLAALSGMLLVLFACANLAATLLGLTSPEVATLIWGVVFLWSFCVGAKLWLVTERLPTAFRRNKPYFGQAALFFFGASVASVFASRAAFIAPGLPVRSEGAAFFLGVIGVLVFFACLANMVAWLVCKRKVAALPAHVEVRQAQPTTAEPEQPIDWTPNSYAADHIEQDWAVRFQRQARERAQDSQK